MGCVWAATHLELDAPVAIKVAHPGPERIRRTAASRREARAAARLRSPHVVQVFDFGTDDGVAFIAMELLVGESLRARLDSEVRLSPRQAGEIVQQAAAALELAHRERIVHRDIKPSNLFLVREKAREVVKVLDFGVAKWMDVESSTRSRTDNAGLVGSAGYMSPEQARGQGVDHRSDVWALGVVAYEMLLGARPFQGVSIPETLAIICTGRYVSPSALVGSAYAVLDPVFARVLDPDREGRYQSVGEFASAFTDAVLSLPSPDTRLEPTARESPEDSFGRDAETASLRVVATSAPAEKRTHSRKVTAILLGASLAGAALYDRWSVKAAPLSPVGQTARRSPAVVSSVSAALPVHQAAEPAASAAVPASAEAPPVATSRRRVPVAPIRRPRLAASAQVEATVPSAPAPSRIDPVFGLEVPER